MSGFKAAKMTGVALAAGLAVAVGGGGLRAQAPMDKVAMTVPILSLSFSYAYLADAMGLWKDQGLDVEVDNIAGLAGTNALLNGDVQFGSPTGSTMLVAAAHGQKEVAIAVVQKGAPFELVISKAAADKSGLSIANSTAAQRGKVLKGLTVAVDGPGTILDGYLRHIALDAGLNPDTDVTIQPLQPAAMVDALKAKKIDGFVISPPWPEIAAASGEGVIWVSSPRGDLPDMDPFLSNVVAARPDYCAQHPSICTRYVTGVKKAMDYMNKEPDKSIAAIAPKFAGMDPAILKAGFTAMRSSLALDGRSTDAMWANTLKFSVEAKMLTAAEAPKGFDGTVYTNDYDK